MVVKMTTAKVSKLYSGRGDTGTSTLFGSQKRLKKTETVFEALGTLDELVSFLGLVRVRSRKNVKPVILEIQHQICTVQAEIAGAKMCLSEQSVRDVERLIVLIEKKLPPLTGFVVPGETELSALFHVTRTVCRRAERAVVAASHGTTKISHASLSFLNRVSSLLYALARQETVRSGKKEQSPRYC